MKLIVICPTCEQALYLPSPFPLHSIVAAKRLSFFLQCRRCLSTFQADIHWEPRKIVTTTTKDAVTGNVEWSVGFQTTDEPIDETIHITRDNPL